METTDQLIRENVYEGKVLEFRRDQRISEDFATGSAGTYHFHPKRKTKVSSVPHNTPTGDDAA